jgi:hypothetical protein
MNIDPALSAQLYKYKSIDLCSSIAGQIMVNFDHIT